MRKLRTVRITWPVYLELSGPEETAAAEEFRKEFPGVSHRAVYLAGMKAVRFLKGQEQSGTGNPSK